MDIMINVDFIKKLRKQRSWSQEQLGSIAGLSLRTVQRIEKEGNASPESAKAIASALEINVSQLMVDEAEAHAIKNIQRGRNFGFMGIFLGMVGAYTGISYSWIIGGMSAFEAGISFGVVAALCGVSAALVGMLCGKLLNKRRKAGLDSNMPSPTG